jgi:hypothetical protein
MGFLLKAVQVAVVLNKFTSAIGATLVLSMAIYNLVKRQRNHNNYR